MAVIQHRRDTAANWTSTNPILAEGEIGLETDTIQYKFGDGATAWAALDYVPTGLAAHLADATDAHNASAISVVPAGDISATDVQSALDELDDEKVSKASVPVSFTVACSDEVTALTPAITDKVKFRMPFAMTLTGVRASLVSACATGTFTVDINESASTVLSTPLTFDATSKTTVGAAVPAVISDSALADDAEVSIDVDDDGDGTAIGLKVTFIGTRSI